MTVKFKKLLLTDAYDGGTITAFIVILLRRGILVELFCQKDMAEVDDKLPSCYIAAYVDISSNETSMAEKRFSSPK